MARYEFRLGLQTYRYFITKSMKEKKRPMHYKEITIEVQKHRIITSKDPEMTILASLIKNKKTFIRTSPGTYYLKEE